MTSSSDATGDTAAAQTSASVEQADRPGPGLLYGLSAGHGIKHFAQGSFLILMPDIRASLGLSDIAVGGVFTAQQIASGIANVPVTLLRDDFGGLQAYLLLCGREYGEWLWSTVSRAGEEFGMQPFGLSAREQLTRERPAGEPLSGAGT